MTRSQLSQLRSNLGDFDDTNKLVLGTDLYVGYRRPELVRNKFFDNDEDLSEYISWKLFLVRQLALMKYKEKWG